MYLKSLTLKGFKSFASATTLKFEPGICAVVGPNGSGKSNVVDALAWVMGEQGAKTLRGGKMQDVIFAGAGERKPLGRAEVTLTIDNSDNKLPIDYTEVSITRRMFRDGASEYEINGNKSRLMDVQELLSDSGIGREMHIIIGQGKLAEILESRPEDRRAYIEEAAGVLKHRRRKEKAQRKLVGMQANLDRLHDLTDELGRQLKPLARQADAARQAASVQATLRDARLKLAGHRISTLRATLADATRRAEELNEQVAAAAELVGEHAGILADVEVELAALTPRAEAAQQLWFRLSTLAERVLATERVATERARGASSLVPYHGADPEELEARAAAAEAEFAELEQAAEIAAERLAILSEEVAGYREAATQAEAEHLAQVRAIADRREGVVRLLAAEEAQAQALERADAEVQRDQEATQNAAEKARTAAAEVNALEEHLSTIAHDREPLLEQDAAAASEAAAAEERLEQLREQQRNRERTVYSLAARIETLRQTAPTRSSAEALAGRDLLPLADFLRPQPGVAAALAAALGAYGEAFVGTWETTDLADLADSERTIVISPLPGEPWQLGVTLPADAQWLSALVHVDSAVGAPLARLLADVVLVPDAAAAQALIGADPRLRAVTPAGDVFGEGWAQVGRAHSSSVLVSEHIATAQAELTQAEAALGELAGTLAGAKHAAGEARVRAATARAALADADAAADSFTRELRRLRTQSAAAAQEEHQVTARLAESIQRRDTAQATLAATRERLARIPTEEPNTEPDTARRDAAQAALAQVSAMEVEAKLALRSAEERLTGQAGRAAGLRRQAAQEREAKARHDRAQEHRMRHGELARVVAADAGLLSQRVAQAVAQAAVRRDELMAQRTELAVRLAQAKDVLSAARAQLSQLNDRAHAADIAGSQAQVRVDEAEAKVVEQQGIAIADLLADYTPDADFDAAAQQERLSQAEQDLAALGKVNPLALEEYKALEERYEFLSTQLNDVEQARRDLGGVIDEVDAKILQLFTDAWHDVAAEFPKVFATLFPGGEGRLLLTDPDDLLATGIELEARPPGKKVKRLSLLSGGEKSLTALALLVAIFRARPSPFYVLDEVEAALDDVNLRRLINLLHELRQDSQLLVITHQKPTMNIANVLYGVTMRDDGVTRVLSQRMSPDRKEITTAD